MDRKWVIAIGVFFVLLICCLLFLPIPVRIKKEVFIKSSIINVSGQFTNLRNWKHWNPLVKQKDSSLLQYSSNTFGVNSYLRFDNHQYTIVDNNAAQVTIEEETDRKKTYQLLASQPDSLGASTFVSWTRVVTPFIWVTEGVKLGREMDSGLNNLKTFMEDPSQFYGFPINVRPIADTLLILKKDIVLKKDIHSIMEKNYAELREYAKSNGLNTNGIRMAGFISMGNNEVQVLSAIPVDKKIPESNSITYMTMPTAGRMIVGSFTGSYHDIDKLYLAMDRYFADKSLRKVALQYEKYYTDPQTAQDSLHMKIEICSPIF